MKRLLTINLLWMTMLCIHAQINTTFNAATPKSGPNHARCVIQDKTGFIWIGSGGGLYRYDGYQYQRIQDKEHPYLLPDESILDISKWGDRYIWMMLRGYLHSCFDIEEDRFVNWMGSDKVDNPYRRYTIANDKSLWLYDNNNGCKHISRDDKGNFHVQEFRAEDGTLPSNHINFIQEDKQGRAWIGTLQGLVCIIDGKSRLIVKDLSFACAQPLGNDICLLAEHGIIYRTKGDGLQTLYTPQQPIPHSMRRVAKEGSQLIISTDGPTLCFDLKSRQLTPHPRIHIDKAQIVENTQGHKVVFDLDGTDLWYIAPQQTFHLPSIYSKELNRQNAGGRFRFIYGRSGHIWISTYGNGLFAYDTTTGSTSHYLSTDVTNALITSDYLMNIFEDQQGSLWVCQENQGMSQIRQARQQVDFRFFTTATDRGHANNIRLIQHVGQQMYIGNRLNELWTTDSQLNIVSRANPFDDDVVAATIDRTGRRWIGTRKHGVYVDGQQLGPLMKGKVSDILCDRKGRVWISMFDGGLELVTTDSDGSMTMRSFFKGSHAIAQPRSMVEDHQGRIWLCSNKGVYLFSPEALLKDETAYQHINVCGNNMNSDEVHCLYEDSQHRLWAGTMGYGIAHIDPQGQVVRRYTTKDGLPNDNVESIIEDRQGRLWIGTDYGLGCLSDTDSRINSYYFSTNELGNMYTEGCVTLLDDGRLAFGTLHGMQLFHPNTVKPQQGIFPLSVTNLYVNGVSLHDMSDDSPIHTAFHQLKRIRLRHDQNSLTFHFSDFEFMGSDLVKFSYLLEGYDEHWSEPAAANSATYKNLPPGSYMLHVRSYNIYGVQNEHQATLNIDIRQPWWNTWWAWVIYLLLAAAITYAIWQEFKHKEQLRTKIAVEQQLTEYKLRFFTNISHEFRTPLTIIRGAIDRIHAMGDIPGNLRQPVSSMQKSTDRLLRLVNELLEFRKIQNQKLRLSLEETNIVSFLRTIFLTFNETAENHRINYQFMTFAREYKMFIDRNYVDKMAYNLLSNAFKYTTRGQSITMRLQLAEDGQLIFEVEDTGIGVSKEKQGDLFTRFNQSAVSRDSIGIGLHMVHELVRVHHGTIAFRENPAGGSIFSITLPTDKSVYVADDFLQTDHALMRDRDEQEAQRQQISNVSYKEIERDPLNNRRLLVVDDDDDMLEYLRTELRRYFMVDTASDGEAALQRIQEQQPDLVVSDVMMPGMNGFELTRKIRQDQQTADLPVILLTAVTDEEKMVKGADCGADAYMEKPFNIKLLTARCRALIEQRDRLRVRYAKEVVGSTPIADIILEDADKKFLERFNAWVYHHMSQADSQFLDFANTMKMGRTTFFKKVKQVTGMTPHDYIRKVRLTEAAKLLKDPTLTVSEVAYKTGFDDPNYFSRIFKEYYGMTATQFKKGKTVNPSETPPAAES